MLRKRKCERLGKTKKVESLSVGVRGGLAISHILLFTLTSKQNTMASLPKAPFEARAANPRNEEDPKSERQSKFTSERLRRMSFQRSYQAWSHVSNCRYWTNLRTYRQVKKNRLRSV